MATTLKDHILGASAKAAPREEVDVPEWGCKVWLREPTIGEVERMELALLAAPMAERKIVAGLLALGIGDQDGSPMFTPEEAGQLRPLSAVKRLYELVRAHVRPSAEDAEKNSGSATTGASSSPLPSPSAEPSPS